MVELLPGMQEALGSFPTLGYLRPCLSKQAPKLTHQRSVGIKGPFSIRLG